MQPFYSRILLLLEQPQVRYTGYCTHEVKEVPYASIRPKIIMFLRSNVLGQKRVATQCVFWGIQYDWKYLYSIKSGKDEHL